MSLDLSIFSIVPPTSTTYKKMVDVYDACVKAGVAIPDEVVAYFGGEEPNPDGVQTKLMYMYELDGTKDHPAITRSTDEWVYTIDITKLPPNSKFIKVCLSS